MPPRVVRRFYRLKVVILPGFKRFCRLVRFVSISNLVQQLRGDGGVTRGVFIQKDRLAADFSGDITRGVLIQRDKPATDFSSDITGGVLM